MSSSSTIWFLLCESLWAVIWPIPFIWDTRLRSGLFANFLFFLVNKLVTLEGLEGRWLIERALRSLWDFSFVGLRTFQKAPTPPNMTHEFEFPYWCKFASHKPKKISIPIRKLPPCDSIFSWGMKKGSDRMRKSLLGSKNASEEAVLDRCG